MGFPGLHYAVYRNCIGRNILSYFALHPRHTKLPSSMLGAVALIENLLQFCARKETKGMQDILYYHCLWLSVNSLTSRTRRLCSRNGKPWCAQRSHPVPVRMVVAWCNVKQAATNPSLIYHNGREVAHFLNDKFLYLSNILLLGKHAWDCMHRTATVFDLLFCVVSLLHHFMHTKHLFYIYFYLTRLLHPPHTRAAQANQQRWQTQRKER